MKLRRYTLIQDIKPRVVIVTSYELKETFEAPENTCCMVDDICIPHTWRTTESQNNKLYAMFKNPYMSGFEMYYNWMPVVLEVPAGNYTGTTLAVAIQELLNGFAVNFGFEVSYHIPSCTIRINATNAEGLNEQSEFIVASNFMVMTWSNMGYDDEPWIDREGKFVSLHDPNNLQSINDALRHDEMTTLDKSVPFYRSYESGFLDLLTVRNIYLHCPSKQFCAFDFGFCCSTA